MMDLKFEMTVVRVLAGTSRRGGRITYRMGLTVEHRFKNGPKEMTLSHIHHG